MAQTKSAAFTTMVAGNDLIVANKVTLTLPDAPQFSDVTVGVESIQVQRSMTTDAPAQTRLITGYPSAQATVAVSGLLDAGNIFVPTSALDLMNPYNPASPAYRDLLIGAQVTVAAGLWVGGSSPELITIFTGVVDSYDIDPQSGVVTLTCLDYRSNMRSVPSTYTTICNPMPVPVGDITGEVTTYITHPGLTNLYMLDLILRQNGFYASPPARPGALWFQSMAGGGFPQLYNHASFPAYCDSYLPDAVENVGWGPDGSVQMQMVPGYWTSQVPSAWQAYGGIYPYGTALGTGPNPVQPGIVWKAGGGYYFEGMFQFFDNSNNFGSYDEYNQASLEVAIYEDASSIGTPPPFILTWTLAINPPPRPAGTATFTTTNDQQFQLNITPGWHQFAVQVNFPTATTCRYRIYLDGAVILDYTEAGIAFGAAANLTATSVNIHSLMPAEGVVLTAETAAVPTDFAHFKPSAYLDASLNPVLASIDVSADDAWAALQTIAESEYGVIGLDELGVCRFLNRHTLAAAQSVRSFYSDASLKQLQLSVQSASAINRVIVPINSVTLGPFQVVWDGPTDGTVIALPVRSPDYPQLIALSQPITGLSTFIYNGLFPPAIPDPITGVLELVGGASEQDGSGYRACKTVNGSGAAVTSGVDFILFQSAPDTFYLDIRNHNNFPVYFVTPTGHGYTASDVGKGLVVVGACPVYFGSDASSATPTSDPGDTGAVAGLIEPTTTVVSAPPANAQWVVDGAVENALQVPANDWIQDPDTAQQLAEDLLDDLVYPRPVLQNVTTIADPSLQLGDRVTIVDPDASLMNDDAVIFGINTTISASDWSQALDMRAVGQPGYWVLDETGHSELSLTTWI